MRAVDPTQPLDPTTRPLLLDHSLTFLTVLDHSPGHSDNGTWHLRRWLQALLLLSTRCHRRSRRSPRTATTRSESPPGTYSMPERSNPILTPHLSQAPAPPKKAAPAKWWSHQPFSSLVVARGTFRGLHGSRGVECARCAASRRRLRVILSSSGLLGAGSQARSSLALDRVRRVSRVRGDVDAFAVGHHGRRCRVLLRPDFPPCGRVCGDHIEAFSSGVAPGEFSSPCTPV